MFEKSRFCLKRFLRFQTAASPAVTGLERFCLKKKRDFALVMDFPVDALYFLTLSFFINK